jgi:TolB protein
MDNYVYATTSPIYISIGGAAPRSPEDAKYFAAWMDRLTEATSGYPDWNNVAEKRGVLERIAQAKALYQGMQ